MQQCYTNDILHFCNIGILGNLQNFLVLNKYADFAININNLTFKKVRFVLLTTMYFLYVEWQIYHF